MTETRQPFDDLLFTVTYALCCKQAKARWPRIKADRHRLEMDDWEPLARFILEHLHRSNFDIVRGDRESKWIGRFAPLQPAGGDDVQPLPGGDPQGGS